MSATNPTKAELLAALREANERIARLSAAAPVEETQEERDRRKVDGAKVSATVYERRGKVYPMVSFSGDFRDKSLPLWLAAALVDDKGLQSKVRKAVKAHERGDIVEN